MKFVVYILYSEAKDRYYKGPTDRVKERLHEHNSGQCKSTKHGRPWELVFTKEFPTRGEAMQYENYLKRRKRYTAKQKVEIVRKHCPNAPELPLHAAINLTSV